MNISAAIPSFNAAATLPAAIASIRAQSVSVHELHVVDDASGDHSALVAQALADRVTRHSKNLGRGAARQRAVLEASGEFLLFCDAGVKLAPDFLERALVHLRNPVVAAAFGPIALEVADTLPARWASRHLFKTGLKQILDRHASLATGAVLLRREAVLRVGNFRADLRAGEDQELGVRLLQAGSEVIFDPRLAASTGFADTLKETLDRYVRWNCAPHAIPAWSEYRKLIGYSGAMLRSDLRAGDLPSAVVTLLIPHYLFWSRKLRGRRSSTLLPSLSSVPAA